MFFKNVGVLGVTISPESSIQLPRGRIRVVFGLTDTVVNEYGLSFSISDFSFCKFESLLRVSSRSGVIVR